MKTVVAVRDVNNPYASPNPGFAPPGRSVETEPVGEVNYALTADDVIAFNLFHLGHTREGKLSSLRHRLLAPALLTALGVVFFRLGQPTPLLAFLILSVPYFFLSPSLQRFRVRRQIRRAPFPRPVARVSVSDYGLSENTADMHVARSWKLIKRLLIGPEGAFFYVDRNVAMIVPKWAFNEEWQYQSFVENARSLASQAGVNLG